MESKPQYQFKKLNNLLNTSFINVKYDVRSLNERVETLKNHIAHLSANSVCKSLEEQNKVILEQQKSINMLMLRLEGIESLHKKATSVQTIVVKEPAKIEKKATSKSKAKSVYDNIKEGEVKITKVQFKAKGNGLKNLNGEWVEITGHNVDMTGYKLHDKNRKHTFKFPKGFTIYGPIKLFTGKGKDTNTRLYWNKPRPVWNDDTDTATLRDNKNRVASKVKSEVTHTFDVLK